MSRAPRFPGMDPWLEHPALWPDVHNSLIAAIRDALVPLYSQPPVPPLPPEDAEWVGKLIAEAPEL